MVGYASMAPNPLNSSNLEQLALKGLTERESRVQCQGSFPWQIFRLHWYSKPNSQWPRECTKTNPKASKMAQLKTHNTNTPKSKPTCPSSPDIGWRFGVVVNTLVPINEVNLCPVSTGMGDRVLSSTPVPDNLSQYRTSHPGQLSLAIPPWVGAVSTSQTAMMPCSWE